MNSHLSLDLGLRILHKGPQYDSRGQESNFFPNLWQASQAPQLFQPGCGVTQAAGGGVPQRQPRGHQSAHRRFARNRLGAAHRLHRAELRQRSERHPSGRKGIDQGNYQDPFITYNPRVGVAYSPTGSQKFVIRGGIGMFDRAGARRFDLRTGRQSALRAADYLVLLDLAAGRGGHGGKLSGSA